MTKKEKIAEYDKAVKELIKEVEAVFRGEKKISKSLLTAANIF